MSISKEMDKPLKNRVLFHKISMMKLNSTPIGYAIINFTQFGNKHIAVISFLANGKKKSKTIVYSKQNEVKFIVKTSINFYIISLIHV